ncbi:flavin reductase family protein [Nocardiopsis ganjiahuensis]|uniref:flavin reductase family protein n=1 Tax=Nocardiopsis ganjiahuensis TaxID=239984 RepID=UPI0003496CF1|nr:flavin reductase family protein [Nocardiopsis ganjiahuensis]
MTDLRRVMSAFATGVVVVTVGGDRPDGMTANSFSSVSLDPPLVLCCVSRAARMHGPLSSGGRFGVSVLSADQEDVARHFADRARPHGWALFARPPWHSGPHTEAPLITGALAWLECEVVRAVAAGDHTVFVAAVLDAAAGPDRSALLFHDSAFHGLRPVPAAGTAD